MRLIGVWVSTDNATHFVHPPMTAYVYDVGELWIDGDARASWFDATKHDVIRSTELKETGIMWQRLL